MTPTVSVVVATYGRPDHVETCLRHLAALRTAPSEIVVVDGSPDDRTREVVAQHPGVVYLRNDLGRGKLPESRQIGERATTGDVLAFLDDDAFAEPEWLDELVLPYADPEVVAVGGRARNGIPGEESVGLGSIGRFLPDGTLTGNFAADPGRVIGVDHILGANMSFRRTALDAIGGIRGDYPGTCLCEESDISLRLRAAGGRLVYAPRAVVEHIAAPYGIGGQRFDRRYQFYARRNHVVLLARNYGFGAPVLRRYLVTALMAQVGAVRSAARRALGRPGPDGTRPTTRERLMAPAVATRVGADLAGLVAGFPAAARARRQDRLDGVATPDPARRAVVPAGAAA